MPTHLVLPITPDHLAHLAAQRCEHLQALIDRLTADLQVPPDELHARRKPIDEIAAGFEERDHMFRRARIARLRRTVEGLRVIATLARDTREMLAVTINDLINLGLLQAPTTFMDDGEA